MEFQKAFAPIVEFSKICGSCIVAVRCAVEGLVAAVEVLLGGFVAEGEEEVESFEGFGDEVLGIYVAGFEMADEADFVGIYVKCALGSIVFQVVHEIGGPLDIDST